MKNNQTKQTHQSLVCSYMRFAYNANLTNFVLWNLQSSDVYRSNSWFCTNWDTYIQCRPRLCKYEWFDDWKFFYRYKITEHMGKLWLDVPADEFVAIFQVITDKRHVLTKMNATIFRFWKCYANYGEIMPHFSCIWDDENSKYCPVCWTCNHKCTDSLIDIWIH